MAAFDFPNSPSTNDTYTANGVTFQWNGSVWTRYSASQGAQGSTGPTGAQGAVGSTGAQGAVGSTGAQGAQGSAGAQGATGAQGAAGAQGAQGTAGSNASISNNSQYRLITGGSGTNLAGNTYATWNGNNLALRGGQNQNCTIELASDEGDNADDFWRVMSQHSDSALAVDHYGTGAWVEKLQIASDGIITQSATHPQIILKDPSGRQVSLRSPSTSNLAALGTDTSHALLFYTNGYSNERMRITNGGVINCGHGSAINLHGSTTTGINLNGNGNSGQIVANVSSNRALIIGRQSDYGQVIEFFQGTNTNEAGITIPAADTLGLETNGSEKFRIKGDGIIEIGTSIGTSSDANIRLRLGRASDCYLGIRATGNDTAETGIKFGDASSEHDGKFAYLHTGQKFRFTVGGNDRIFIEQNGDLKGQSSNANVIGFMGAKTTSGTTNWNDSTNARSGNGHTLLLGNHSNGPGGSLYYHPFTFEYITRDGTGNMTQLAIPYNGGTIYSRYRYSGSWSGWTSH